MKKWFKNNLILLIIAAVGIAAAIGIVAGRAVIEQKNKTYDIVMDYSSLCEMADQSEEDIEYWLEFFRENGVNKIGLFETSIKSLAKSANGNFYMITAEDIKSDYGWQSVYPAPVVKMVEASEHSSDLLVICDDLDEFQWIIDAFEDRAENVKYDVEYDVDVGYLWIYGNEDGVSGETWAELCLGLWPETVELIESYGYSIVPRTTTVDGINGSKFASAVLNEYSDYNTPYYLASGDSMLGYDDKENGTKLLTEYLESHDISVGLTENSTQSCNITWPGFNSLVEDLNYKAVRVFSMWPYVQNSYAKYNYDGPEEITNCLYRAVYERNCHLIYLKMMYEADSTEKYIIDSDSYAQLLGDLYERMDARGYTYQTLEAAQSYQPSAFLRFIVGVGAISACIVLLNLFIYIPGKVKYILLILGAAAVAAAMYIMPNTSKLLLSIGGGIVMPCLAAVGVNRYIQFTNSRYKNDYCIGRLLLQTIVVTIVLTAVSFCGSLYTSSALSETAYMLEMNLYRGVKIMQLIPIAVFFISFIQIFVWEKYICRGILAIDADNRAERRAKRRESWNALLDRPVKVRGVYYGAICFVVLCILGAAGIYYLARTGHSSSIQASTIELEFRNLLEIVLPARPRTKEFLIGYPCAMLMLWSYRRKVPALPVVLGAGAVIGFTSVVNTFLHIRTPFMLSVIRVLIGLAIGLVIGIVLVIIAEIIYRQILKHKRLKNV